MKSIDKQEVERLLPFPTLVQALYDVFREDVGVPLRMTLPIPDETHRLGTSLIMPAWNLTGYYGVKLVNIYPQNTKLGLPGLHSVYILFDSKTGVPLATLDGDVITSRRTAAASALGVKLLARRDASSLLVLGAGRVGQLLAPAVAAVRDLKKALIWNPNPTKAQACAAQWREQGFDAEAVTDLEAAARSVDIISCATLAEKPLIQADWLQPGVHLDLIGSFTPAMTEADPACFAVASTWIDTDEAPKKAGDLLNAFTAGTLTPEAIRGTLAELCLEQCPARTSDSERTLFKAVGSAREDLAAAITVYEQSA